MNDFLRSRKSLKVTAFIIIYIQYRYAYSGRVTMYHGDMTILHLNVLDHFDTFCIIQRTHGCKKTTRFYFYFKGEGLVIFMTLEKCLNAVNVYHASFHFFIASNQVFI